MRLLVFRIPSTKINKQIILWVSRSTQKLLHDEALYSIQKDLCSKNDEIPLLRDSYNKLDN
jgi:hypothetical protein